MRILASMDFWLWLGVGMSLTFMAAAVQPIRWLV